MLFMFLLFFFFKQKTAYEMRISDWSSDVCSSDLAGDVAGGERRQAPAMEAREGAVDVGEAGPGQHALGGDVAELLAQGGQQFRLEAVGGRHGAVAAFAHQGQATAPRSEEHTSELQSLKRH